MQFLIGVVLVVCVHHTSYAASTGKAIASVPNESVDNADVVYSNLTYSATKPKNYPKEHVAQLLKNNILQRDSAFNATPISSFESRLEDPVNVCEGEVTMRQIYQVRRKVGDWRMVVQAPEQNYVQHVRLEICKNPGASCLGFSSTNLDYRSECVQGFTPMQFLVVKDDNNTELVETEMPTHCLCKLQMNTSN